jgi:hypothetical protein
MFHWKNMKKQSILGYLRFRNPPILVYCWVYHFPQNGWLMGWFINKHVLGDLENPATSLEELCQQTLMCWAMLGPLQTCLLPVMHWKYLIGSHSYVYWYVIMICHIYVSYWDTGWVNMVHWKTLDATSRSWWDCRYQCHQITYEKIYVL